MKLDIILRTCSNSLLTPTDKKRVVEDSREILIKKCFYSLVLAIKNSQHQVKLTVLDDNSDSRFLEYMKYTAAGVDFNIVNLKERGHNQSAVAQFKMATECDGIVYMVEDDYLHEETAIDHLMNAYLYFTKRYNTDVVIFPYDCSMRYTPGYEPLCRVYHDGIRYWRSVNKTSYTMLCHYSVIKQNWDTFKYLAENYPKVLEDDTINKLYYNEEDKKTTDEVYDQSYNVYYNFKQDSTKMIRVFSPMPSIAYHLGYSPPTEINTSHSKWQQLWNRIDQSELIQGWFYSHEFFNHIINNLKDESTIVEIGSWRGKSTCYLGSLIKKYNKNIKIYAIDTWEGSQNEDYHKQIIENMPLPLYDDFMANVKMCNVENVIEPMKMTSVEASTKFEDKSVDFVFIDGAHDYDSVKEDLEHWLPKVKKGGLIGGDDYGGSWVGVKKAVDEKFSGKVNVHGSTWYVPI